MIMKNINWNWIYYFYEVARYSSMTDASRVMGISLSTISEQISHLEKELNVKLFHRSIRKLDLTREGQALYTIVKEMFKYGPMIVKNLSPDMIGGNQIKIGVQEGIATEYSSSLFYDYWDKYIAYGTVGVERISMLEELVRNILKGKLEWGIACEVTDHEKIALKKVATEEVQFCCSKNIYDAFKDKKDIIKYIPFISNSWDHALNEKVSNHLALLRCTPNEYIEIDQRDLVLDLIRNDRCVSVFTKQTIKKLSTTAAVKGFSMDKAIFMDFYLLWDKERSKSLSIKKLLELCEPCLVDKGHDSFLQLKVVDIPKELLISPLF
ncbi:MAG: LysR family transcriptional regulator [Oligoflexia bacterium]|nr:LysR family transcriptional regulator [Oligoflexia bacterium]